MCGTRSSPALPAAELAWGLVLSLARSIAFEHVSVRAGGWQSTMGMSLSGSTLGLVGLGQLGKKVAGYGRAFGMRVIAWSPNLTDARAAEGGAELATKVELLKTADIVSIHLVLGPRSRDAIGETEFRHMKPTAYLVNTSRGPIVNEEALVRALREGRIAGAALDVYDSEPLATDHPLRSEPRALLTPHIGYVTQDNYKYYYGYALENIKAFLAGSPVRVLKPAAD